MIQLENETLNNMDMLNNTQYIFPFLAHAMGTLVGAVCALRIAGEKQPIVAWLIGLLFLAVGHTWLTYFQRLFGLKRLI